MSELPQYSPPPSKWYVLHLTEGRVITARLSQDTLDQFSRPRFPVDAIRDWLTVYPGTAPAETLNQAHIVSLHMLGADKPKIGEEYWCPWHRIGSQQPPEPF